MEYDQLALLLKRYIYVMYHERYTGISSEYGIEKWGGKHPLLKPELIVVNDQLQGFKRPHAHLKSLEQFPVFIEFEYRIDGEMKWVEAIDIQSEIEAIPLGRLPFIKRVATLYAPTVSIDRVTSLANRSNMSLLIASRLNEQLEEWLESDGPLGSEEIEREVTRYLHHFVDVVHTIKLILFGKEEVSPDA